MPVDPAMVTAVIGTFRDLLAGSRAGGSTSADIRAMEDALADMEALGQELDDVGELAGRLAADGHYQRFTDAYTREMTAAASGSTTGVVSTIPDDETLLAQTLQAYEGALQQLRTVPGQDDAIAGVEQVVAIGRSGVTYPVFLRQVDEAGLGEALAGAVVPSRGTLTSLVDHSRSTGDVAREAEAVALLAARDALVAGSPTGTVDPFTFELERFRIASRHAPEIARRDAIVERLPRLLDLVIDWVDAHTSWAERDDRFAGATSAETRRNVERARECNPGFYVVRARQFEAAFGPTPWWRRPELQQERTAGRILWSDERLAVALDAIPALAPYAVAPADLVARAEAFGPNRF